MFSIDRRIELPDFSSAGPTRLEELGYDILHLREYYHHHPVIDDTNEGEALVQSLKIDANNPRLIRFITEGIERRGVAPEAILKYGKKYGLKETLKKVVNGRG